MKAPIMFSPRYPTSQDMMDIFKLLHQRYYLINKGRFRCLRDEKGRPYILDEKGGVAYTHKDYEEDIKLLNEFDEYEVKDYQIEI